MKPDTIKQGVKDFLADGEWRYAGSIGAEIGARLKHKSSIVERRLREYESGKGSDGNACEKLLEKRYVSNPSGKGPKVVQYRLRQVEVKIEPTRFRPDFLKGLLQKRAQELQGNLFSY